MRPDALCLDAVSDTEAKTTDFESSDREAALELTSLVKYICPHKGCKLQFKRRDALDRHEFSHSGIRQHVCSVAGCDKQYMNLSHLKRHVRTVHETRAKAVDSGAERLPCPTAGCTKTFTNRTSMLRHNKTAHLNAKPHQCEHCPAAFQHKNQLRRHLPIHTGQFPYKCDECPQGFPNLRQYSRHKTIHKLGKQPEYKCPECEKAFAKWSEMVSHRRQKHPFKCSACDRVFESKTTRKAHMAVHRTDGPVFECPIDGCPKHYSWEKNLMWHIERKHGESDGSQFECDMCGRKLSTKQKMADHLAWHVRCPDGKVVVRAARTERLPRKDKGKSRWSVATQLTDLVEQEVSAVDECDPIDEQKSLETIEKESAIVDTSIDDHESPNEATLTAILEQESANNDTQASIDDQESASEDTLVAILEQESAIAEAALAE